MTKIDESGVGKRLKMVLNDLKKKRHFTQGMMAERLNISQGYLSQIFAGSRDVSGHVLTMFANAFKNYDLYWLITGNGEMQSPTINSQVNIVSEPDIEYIGRHVRKISLSDLPSVIDGLLTDLDAVQRRLDDLERQINS